MKMTHLSHGFYAISNKEAGALVGGAIYLPRPGYEKLVSYDGKYWWLCRTPSNGKVVWSVREAQGWRLDENGTAVLGGLSLNHSPYRNTSV
jgi:hypothetical protein